MQLEPKGKIMKNVNSNVKPVLTIQDIAKRWEAAPYFVQELVDNGELPSFKITSTTNEEYVSRVRLIDLERWEVKQTAQSTLINQEETKPTQFKQRNIPTWLLENGIRNENGSRAEALYKRYATWCASTERNPVSNTRFGIELMEAAVQLGWLGISKSRDMYGVVYHGISF